MSRNFFLTYRTAVDDHLTTVGEAPGYRTTGALDATVTDYLLHYRADPDTADEARTTVNDFAQWLNRDAVPGLENIAVSQEQRLISVTVADSLAAETRHELVRRAYLVPMCLFDDRATTVVNGTGVFYGVTAESSDGTVQACVTPDTLTYLLTSEVLRHEDTPGGLPFLILTTPFARTWSQDPEQTAGVPGVLYTQAAKLPDGWHVEYRTPDAHFELQAPRSELVDTVRILWDFTCGDVRRFDSHGWTMTEELDGSGRRKYRL